MKTFGILSTGCLGLVLLTVLGFAVGIISLPFHTASNLIQTAHDITDKTINADNALYNYEWFKQQYEDLQAIEKKINIAHTSEVDFSVSSGDRKSWTFEDKTEDSRLRAVEQGLRSQSEDMISVYNARSKMANRAIFKYGLIPDYLEVGKNILVNL